MCLFNDTRRLCLGVLAWDVWSEGVDRFVSYNLFPIFMGISGT